jgi:hypothetical protein
MSADTNSIFYKIGQATKSNVSNAIDALKAADNNFTGTNTFAGITTTSHTSSGAIQGATVAATGALSGSSLSVTGNTTITGDLTVSGTTTTISSTNLEVKDNLILLNDGAKSTSSTASDAGLMLERKSGADNAAFLFQETDGRFELGTTNADGTAGFGTVSLGALAVNSLLVGTRAETVALGNLADFNAGLSA